jgi:hypothetical protein
MIDRKCTWTATQQDRQHRRPLDMDGPGQRIDEKAGTPEPVIGPHEACVTANFNAAFAVSLEAVFADEWTNAGRCRDGSTSAMGWLSIATSDAAQVISSVAAIYASQVRFNCP